jgi:hypothetical protein
MDIKQEMKKGRRSGVQLRLEIIAVDFSQRINKRNTGGFSQNIA